MEIEQIKSKQKCYKRQMDTVSIDESGQVPIIRFKSVEKFPWVSLGFSTKFGGVSTGYLESLNLGWNQGDLRENVVENYKRIANSLHVDWKKIVLSDQVHDKVVKVVSEKETTGEQFKKHLEGVDGLVTKESGITLATSYADCVPIFFIDQVNKVIASSHSGWKGTVQKIGQETLRVMKENFGTNPENVHVVIGPSICQDCYEVSKDVIEQFQEAYKEEIYKDIFYPTKGDKYQLDMWAAIWHQLKDAGVKEETIFISGVCTCCNHKILFSHRKTQGKRGNLNGFMTIVGE